MLEYVLLLIATAVLFYLTVRLTEIKDGEGFSFVVYPWITTLPETLVTLMYFLGGYTTAGLLNSVFSATFDYFVVVGLSAVLHSTIVIADIFLVIMCLVSGLAFSFTILDSQLTVVDSVMLYAILFVMLLYGIRKMGRPKPSYGLIGLVAGLALSTPLSYMIYLSGEGLIGVLGEKYVGVLSAVVTSIPDLIVALVLGLDSDALASLLGCIAHDFVENIPTAVIIASAFGVSGITITDVVPTLAVTAITLTLMVATASYGRVGRAEGLALLILFALMALLI